MIQAPEATDLYQNGISGAVGTSGSVLRTRTWAASQAVRPASIPSLSATCATVPILLHSKGQPNSGPKTARETFRAYAAKIQYCMLLDDSGSIRDRRTSIRVQWETTVVRTRMVVSPPSIISAYYSVGIGGAPNASCEPASAT